MDMALIITFFLPAKNLSKNNIHSIQGNACVSATSCLVALNPAPQRSEGQVKGL